MGLRFAWQMLGQWTPPLYIRSRCVGGRFRGGTLDCRRVLGCFHLLQIFQPQFQLFDLPLQLFRFTPELHPPQLAQQQLQMCDLTLLRKQLLVSGNPFLVFRQKQRLQRFSI
jgi:hypothetical protein